MTPESPPAFLSFPAGPMPGPRGAAPYAAPRADRGAGGRRPVGRAAAGRVTRRAALAVMAGIPALAACTRIAGAGATGTATSAPPPAVGSMAPEVTDLEVDVKQPSQGEEEWSITLTPKKGLKNDKAVMLPSQAGPLVALVSGYDPFNPTPDDSPDAALMSFDPANGSLTWARLVSLPGGAAPYWGLDPGRLEYQVKKVAARSSVVVSPDGRRVSVILRAYVSPTLSEHVSAAAVLDTASGQVVRTEEIRGFVLGQALTDDALIVQTSDFPYPGGDNVIAGPNRSDAATSTDDAGGASSSGAGSTLTIFPLADPQAPATTGSTPLWLLGATHDSLILGAARIGSACFTGNCLGYRASLATATGRVTGQIDGVYAVHPSGLLERFTGGEADDGVLSNTVRHAADQDGSHRGQTWIGLSRELLDPASGTAADITGLTLSDVPTATTWITARWRPAWSEEEKGKALFKPEADGWMAAPGDPVSTEPTMTLDRDDNPSKGSPVITVSLTRTAFTGRTA